MLGALCVQDRAPRQLEPAQRRTLASLAEAAAELLALRLKVGEVERERARLADFARASGDWMWETDAALRYTWISPTYQAVTGVPAREWLGRAIVDTPLLDTHGQPLADGATLHGLMARAEPYARVLTEQHIGARRLFVLRSAVPVFEAGALVGWRGTSRDLTARVALGERARERENMLAKLAAGLPGVVFQYRRHPDGRVSYPYVSARVREVYGIEPPSPDDLREVEQSVRMLLPEDRPSFLASIEESARGLTRWVHEYRIVRADGALRWLESRSIPERLPDGGILWHGFTADITERKAMELALRRTEERWELAAEAAGIGRATLDLASRAMEFDRRACLNHGLPWPHPPLSFDEWRDAIDPEQRDAVVRELESAVAEHRVFEMRCRVRGRDGEQRLIEMVARATYGADGHASAVVGTCRDVTEQAAAEQLRRDKESAERANRAKTEFLSRVSHELRTPLNSILGFAQLMALDAQQPLPAGQRRRLDNVQQAGRHLLGLINDVLELTRIEQAEAALECGPVDALAALRACLATLEPLALEAAVGVAPLPPAGAGAWVSADARALQQVLMNLLSNAIKYNRRGGTVTLTLDARAGADGPRVEIGVHDDGPGLSQAQQAALFQPFNRLGAERGAEEGTGLGLVLSRHLVDLMGGQLLVDSRPGAGSTFTVSLPQAPATAVPASAAGAAAAPAVPTLRPASRGRVL
ncbi:MAG TPA: ATP-binding protein, partial [Burkholderiaceae bacterium]